MDTIATQYHNVLNLAQQLDPLEQLRLLETLAVSVRHQVAPRSRRSILELQGLGKAIWQDVDVQAYVQEERASWNG